ncbi:hypothetical protein PFISCL1PPCAC_21796, partial [Pristionchus fissidentatus]
ESPLKTVEELRKKMNGFSGQSKDMLFTVINRALDAMSVIIDPSSDSKCILRSLAALEFERTQSLQDDEEREVAFRDVVYGLIHCVHLTLQGLTRHQDTFGATSVDKLRRKIHDFSGQSRDILYTVINRALDAMSVILDSSTDSKCIQRSLAALEFERIQ